MFWNSKQFEFKDIPDLSGKIAIVTGSNTGIGRVCALEMARKNCQVVVAARNAEKANAVVDEIKKETGNDKVEYIHLDLLSLASVKKFADEFRARYDQLHILMNNAGVMMAPYSLSEDGLERQFATNHVAHYYLTMLLLPVLEKSTPSRIVNVSSMGHMFAKFFGGLQLHNINDEKTYHYGGHYCKSKAANILFTRELAKRLKNKGVEIYVNCNHPGVVGSDLYRHMFAPTSFLMSLGKRLLYITNEDGALAQLYVATSPEIEEKKLSGEYFVPYGKLSKSDAYTRSDENAAELWEWTEKVLKEKAPGYEGAPI